MCQDNGRNNLGGEQKRQDPDGAKQAKPSDGINTFQRKENQHLNGELSKVAKQYHVSREGKEGVLSLAINSSDEDQNKKLMHVSMSGSIEALSKGLARAMMHNPNVRAIVTEAIGIVADNEQEQNQVKFGIAFISHEDLMNNPDAVMKKIFGHKL
jgi:hypothetical protein